MSFFQGEGPAHTITKVVFRSLQFVLGLTVAGIYGNYVHNQQAHNQPSDSAFVFAVVVGGASCITPIIYLIPRVKAYYAFPWDACLSVFWLAVFAKFASLFLNRNSSNPKDVYQGTNTQQMKNAVWIDLISLSLWALTAAYGTWVFLRNRRLTKNVDFGGAGTDYEHEVAMEKPQPAQYVYRAPSRYRKDPVSPLRQEEMYGDMSGPPSPIHSQPPPIRFSSKPNRRY